MSTTLTKVVGFTGLLCLGIVLNGYAQSDVLENYVKSGLDKNLVLQQKNISLEQALLSLKSARGMFLPSVEFSGAYQSGEGGRYIDLPIGDLLNPVYSTLNQLTASDAFPQVSNVNQSFLPNNFYDVKLHAVMPLVNTDLIYNRQLQSQKITLNEYGVDAYKRELVKEIKVAYFNYLSSLDAVNIYSRALELAIEGKRVNESLLSNGKGLPASVLRADAEVESLRAQLNDAEKNSQNARLYFNFLLNADPEAPVDTNYNAAQLMAAIPMLIQEKPASSSREELKSLEQVVSLNETVLKMNRSYSVPQLAAFGDVGFQGDNLQWNDKSDYYFVGLQLSVPLFKGFTNRYKIASSKLDKKAAELQLEDAKNGFRMSLTVAHNRLSSAFASYQASRRQLSAAESYHRLVEKGYREGVFTFIEMLDARNQLTTAAVQVNLQQQKVLSAMAMLEREAASYSLVK
jgi:outer membrane protein